LVIGFPALSSVLGIYPRLAYVTGFPALATG